jgi:hypothetical protein
MYVDAETPSGTIDGVNKVFTLSQTPFPAGSLQLSRNGILQTAGGVDYTLAGATITYTAAPLVGDAHWAWYRVLGAGDGGGGMMRDEAVAIIANRLGQRTGLNAQIVTEIILAQNRLEQEPFLPWFLEAELSVTFAAGQNYTLPSDCLRLTDFGVWAVVSEKHYQLRGDDYDVLRRNESLLTAARPEYFALQGSVLHLFPLPDINYSARVGVAEKAIVLSSNLTNSWLQYAADVLVSLAGERMAKFLRDWTIADRFREERQEALAKLAMADAARRESGQSQPVLGG